MSAFESFAASRDEGVAARLIKPDDLFFVVVGGATGLTPTE